MNNPKKPVIQGESSGLDKGALVCDGIMLAICLWNQLRYGMDMLFLIIPLVGIGAFLFVFGVMPETYHFTDHALEIVHKFRKTKYIPYETVFNYEASARDSFVNITQKNLVKVYYTEKGKKQLVLCRPCGVETFVDALKANCSEFHEEQKQSRLDVFFNHGKQNAKGD